VSVTRSNNSQVLLTKKNVHTISLKGTSSDNDFSVMPMQRFRHTCAQH